MTVKKYVVPGVSPLMVADGPVKLTCPALATESNAYEEDAPESVSQ